MNKNDSAKIQSGLSGVIEIKRKDGTKVKLNLQSKPSQVNNGDKHGDSYTS